jgi:hypothetical protein
VHEGAWLVCQIWMCVATGCCQSRAESCSSRTSQALEPLAERHGQTAIPLDDDSTAVERALQGEACGEQEHQGFRSAVESHVGGRARIVIMIMCRTGSCGGQATDIGATTVSSRGTPHDLCQTRMAGRAVSALERGIAQFLAVCSASTVAEALCISSPLSSQCHDKRRTSWRRMPLLRDQH